jgi:oxygen-independent coproporphyrinogen-3 oxidase
MDSIPTDNTIAKYLSERIPRYTSYPTAPHFSNAIGPATYREWLTALRATDRLSLYLHIPFCKTLCWYCGCNTSVTRHREPVERYVRTLELEIARVAELAGSHRVAHVHWVAERRRLSARTSSAPRWQWYEAGSLWSRVLK